jgi:ribose transport system substrate-binding protein
MFWLETQVVDETNVDRYLSFVQQRPSSYDWKKMSRVLNPDNWENQGAWSPINPIDFWKERNLGKPEPKNWLPTEIQQALDNGDFDKLVAEYKAHTGTQPI